MTTDSVPAGGDPRRLLSDVRALAHRVRLEQRVTWFALLVLAAATFVGIAFDWYFLDAHCVPTPDGSECRVWHRGAAFYWPPALLLAYTAIAVCYVRVARARGLGARVLPYAFTGAAGAVLYTAAGLVVRQYLLSHPVPTHPLPYWALLLDRLIAPWGTIGVALLVLAWLERHVALLAFTLGYLAVVLVPIDFGWGADWGYSLRQQAINGTLLLLGAIGFALARQRHR
ncbi:hypothetical protein [Dactylosporangium sp. NPDC049140]|uniref:hypothetical protein n=1 Tax=Dactylosporangium sp. NPDC049140 TaxID=3155647 RepID=UPI0033F69436